MSYFRQFCICFVILKFFIWTNSFVPWWSYIQGTIQRRSNLQGMDFEHKIFWNFQKSHKRIENGEFYLNMFHLKIGTNEHQSLFRLMIQNGIASGNKVWFYHGHNLSKLTWWPSNLVVSFGLVVNKPATVRLYCFNAASWNHLVIAAVKIKVYVLWIGQL